MATPNERITRETIIANILKKDPCSASIFLNNGMHCLGCPASSGESIEEACAVHGIDVDKLIKDLNEHFGVSNSDVF